MIHRIEKACQPDFDHIGAEGTDAGDNLDIAGAHVRGAVIDVLNCVIDILEFREYTFNTFLIADSLERSERGFIVSIFFRQALLFASELGLSLFCSRGSARCSRSSSFSWCSARRC